MIDGPVAEMRCDFHCRRDAVEAEWRGESYFTSNRWRRAMAGDGYFAFRVVVNKSTFPVGSGNLVGTLSGKGSSRRGRFREEDRGMRWPAPGVSSRGVRLSDSFYPDRIVDWDGRGALAAILRELYAPLCRRNLRRPPFLPRRAGMGKVSLVRRP